MNRTPLIITMAALGLTFTFSNSYAMDRAPKSEQADRAEQIAPKAARDGRFHEDEIQVIRDYYRDYDREHDRDGKKKTLPKGLQKKYERTGELPPGWEKKLQRGEVLSEDVYRYGQPLPVDLKRQLPYTPEGSEIIEVEGKIIRVLENSREIIDILNLETR
ncbi:MAG TPA: hypothetical protein VIM93_02835 [Kangiella sp.]